MTAADQTPATDSERDALIALLLKHGHAEWDHFDAQTVADVIIANWATPRLAEQAATIERVRAVHRPVPYGSEKTRSVAPWVPENVCDHCLDDYGGCVDYPCATARALGSQRTEGQG